MSLTGDVTVHLLVPVELTGLEGKDEKELIFRALLALQTKIENIEYIRLRSTDALKYDVKARPAGTSSDPTFSVFHDADQIELLTDEVIDGAETFNFSDESAVPEKDRNLPQPATLLKFVC